MAKKKKYYVVWEGNTPGVYDSWTACQLQIKGYPNAKYKSFSSREAAEAAYRGNFNDFMNSEKKSKSKPTIDTISEAEREKIIWKSIAVDAACSGNPGVMEYQGVDTATGTQIFYKKFRLGTNNIGEFLAIVHALAKFKQTGEELPIYTDSRTAMKWVANKKCNTKLTKNQATAALYQVIGRAEQWLRANTYKNEILKWDTEHWGEIPADFGRK